MTAEQKVKKTYPTARVTCHSTTGGRRYYLAWSGGPATGRRLGEGKTKSAVWVDAARDLGTCGECGQFSRLKDELCGDCTKNRESADATD